MSWENQMTSPESEPNAIKHPVTKALVELGATTMPSYETWQAIDGEDLGRIIEETAERLEIYQPAKESDHPNNSVEILAETPAGSFNSDPVVYESQFGHAQNLEGRNGTNPEAAEKNLRIVVEKDVTLMTYYDNFTGEFFEPPQGIFRLSVIQPLLEGGHWSGEYLIIIENSSILSLTFDLKHYANNWDPASRVNTDFNFVEKDVEKPKLLETLLIQKKPFDHCFYLEVESRNGSKISPNSFSFQQTFHDVFPHLYDEEPQL